MGSQQFFREKLERRAKRLADLVEMSAPSQMVGREVALVVQAALGYCPQEVTHALSSWLVASVRRDAGFCNTCETKLPECEQVCQSCREKAEGDETIKTYNL